MKKDTEEARPSRLDLSALAANASVVARFISHAAQLSGKGSWLDSLLARL